MDLKFTGKVVNTKSQSLWREWTPTRGWWRDPDPAGEEGTAESKNVARGSVAWPVKGQAWTE